MANIQARKNKDGKIISYSIRVHKGRDQITGKQLKPYTMTWDVPDGWSEKTAEKEAKKQAVLFERQCKDGIALDNRQTFAAYAEYVLAMKERTGVKHQTIIGFRQDLERMLPAIGHLKLIDIRPQHLNQLYEQLAQPGMRKDTERATSKVDIRALLVEKGVAGQSIWNEDGSRTDLKRMFKGEGVKLFVAQRVADFLEMPMSKLFNITRDERPLAGRTIQNSHLLISTILAEAEKEMLIPFNPARRATPPKKEPHNPNYMQMDDIARLWEALEQEPLRWRMMIHMFMVTGCRRGEILGLKWEKVDWDHNQIYIDRAIVYAHDIGNYETTPKTKGSVRYIKLPTETMKLFAEYRKWHTEQRFLWGNKWQDTGYVFTREDGGMANPSQVANWLNKFTERHNLPHINPHAFRHTQASVLFFNGVDPISVSKRLGHAHVSTTTDIYSHFIEEAEARMTDCVADVILAAKPKSDMKNAVNG